MLLFVAWQLYSAIQIHLLKRQMIKMWYAQS